MEYSLMLIILFDIQFISQKMSEQYAYCTMANGDSTNQEISVGNAQFSE